MRAGGRRPTTRAGRPCVALVLTVPLHNRRLPAHPPTNQPHREIIDKEDRIARDFQKAHPEHLETEAAKQPEEPKTKPAPPPAQPRELTDAEKEEKMLETLSKHMWRTCNPGYQPRTHRVLPQSKEDFSYKMDLVDTVDKTHFRKRDNFTKYVEASSMYKLLSK